MKSHRTLSRRTFLRGAGVTMALPWFESLPAFAAGAKTAAAAANEPPMRMAILFSGNGFSDEWKASGKGASMELGKILAPMNPYRGKLNLINGLYNEEAYKIPAIHACQTGNLLSGAPLAGGGVIRSGTSIDQVVSQQLGDQTKVPSLVLGCEPVVSDLGGGGFSSVYSTSISWSSPTTPTPLEVYPALAFDRLFVTEAGRSDRSVVDAILEDSKDLRSRVNPRDRLRLDEYLNSVRELERQIEQAGRDRHLQGWRPTLDKPNIARPPEGTPQNIAQHMRFMCDILVLALQTDTTRVCTLKLNNDLSSMRFPELGVNEIHHLLSHGGGGPDDWPTVNKFFVEQVAYIAGRLEAIQEGERTLLDNTNMLYLSSMFNGAAHDASRLPVMTVGGGAKMKTGQVLDYQKDPNRQMCRLYLSLMDKMGVRLDKFGDATAPLAEL